MLELTAGINNQSLEIVIPTRNYEAVNYTILSKDVMKGEVVLQLFYKDPSKISASNEPDLLQVTVIHEIEIKQDEWLGLLRY